MELEQELRDKQTREGSDMQEHTVGKKEGEMFVCECIETGLCMCL